LGYELIGFSGAYNFLHKMSFLEPAGGASGGTIAHLGDTSLLKLCSLFADTYVIRKLPVSPLQTGLSISTIGAAVTKIKWNP
jgi:hypothetical protein